MVINLVSNEQATENLLRALEQEFESLSDQAMTAEVRAFHGDEKKVLAKLDNIVERRLAVHSSTSVSSAAQLLLACIREKVFFALSRPAQIGLALSGLTALIAASVFILYFRPDTVEQANRSPSGPTPVPEIVQQLPAPLTDPASRQQGLQQLQEAMKAQSAPAPGGDDAEPDKAAPRIEDGLDTLKARKRVVIGSGPGAVTRTDETPPKPEGTVPLATPPIRPPNGEPIASFEERLLSLYDEPVGALRLRWIEIAADHGDADAQTLLGFLADTGASGVEQNVTKAVSYYQRSADRNAFARLRLAYLYEAGPPEIRNLAEALRLYSIAAKEGSDLAQERLDILKSVQPAPPP